MEQDITNIINECIECNSLEELYKKLETCINSEFTWEDFICNFFIHSYYNPNLVYQLLVDTIQKGDKQKVFFMLQNLDAAYNINEILQSTEFQRFVIDNFQEAFAAANYSVKNDLINALMKNEEGINKIKEEIVSNDLMAQVKPNTLLNVLIKLLTTKEGLQFVSENLGKVILNRIDFMDIERMVLKGVPEAKIIENRQVFFKQLDNENFVKFMTWLRTRGAIQPDEVSLDLYMDKVYPYVKDKTSRKTIEIIYEELLQKQKKLEVCDIKFLGRGMYSSTYQVGDFVVKIGRSRDVKLLPANERLLQPLVRQSILCDLSEEDEESKESSDYYYLKTDDDDYEEDIDTLLGKDLFVEVQNLVDSKWYKELTKKEIEDKLYEIYRELRDDGIVWSDIKKENVGRLLRRNTTNFPVQKLVGIIDNGTPVYDDKGRVVAHRIEDTSSLHVVEEEMEVDDASIGIKRIKKREPLQQDKLVILDSDYMFLVDEINLDEEIKNHVTYEYVQFEKRYREELKQREQRKREQEQREQEQTR